MLCAGIAGVRCLSWGLLYDALAVEQWSWIWGFAMIQRQLQLATFM
jgi:hypothetical protein